MQVDQTARNWRRLGMASIQKISCATRQKSGNLSRQTGNFERG